MIRPKIPFPPNIDDYKNQIGKPETLKSFKYVDDECEDKYIESCECDEISVPEYESWDSITKVCSIQDLLDSVPKGTDPKDVSLIINRDREAYYISVSLVSNLPSSEETQMKAYELALEKYKEDDIQFRKNLKEYKNFLK